MKTNKNAALGFVFATVLIDVIGLAVIIPVVPKLIAQLGHEDLNHASRDGSLLVATYAIMQFLFSPVIGGLSDRFGRRPVLLFSLLGFGLDYIFQAFAPTLGWLFVGRALAGITGASFTTASAYVTDVSEPEKRAQNFGIIYSAFGLGFIIGPFIGGVSAAWGIRTPFMVAAALSLLNFVVGYFMLPESLKPEHRRRFEWKRANALGSLMVLRKYPLVSGLVVSLTLINIASHAVQSNWSYFTMYKFHWSERMVGYSLTAVGALTVLVQAFLIRIITPKIGVKKAVYYGFACYAIGLLLFGLADKGWMMFAILGIYCLGGIGMPALQGIVSGQVPANARGELQGGLTSLMSITMVIGPLLMNNLFYLFTRPQAKVHFAGAPFIMGAILVVASLLFAMYYLRRRLQPEDHLPAEEKEVTLAGSSH